MKKIFILLLLAFSIFVFYQLQRPLLTATVAITKAKEYVNIVNEKMNLEYDTSKKADYSVVESDSFWNKVKGNTQWEIMIDGVAVIINAYTGEFVQMVFPLDGMINELPE